VAGSWRVRDVAAHLLQGELGRLSRQRDGYVTGAGGVLSYDEVLHIINSANREAIAAMQRYSPRVLLELLEWSGLQLTSVIEAADPFAAALYSVAWAGEDSSLNWMDTGREYTERWHHQQQIRDAVGLPLLLQPEWTEPLYALSVRALPRAYRDLHAPEKTVITLRIENGGDWSLVRETGNWRLFSGTMPAATCGITVSADDAWRIFYNALAPDAALRRLQINGDRALALPFAGARSVMV
jgi:hypothetical protein